MLPTIRRFLLTGALTSAMLFAVGTVAAALVAEIKDDGGFFDAATISKANDVIKDIHRDFKKDLLIETFKTVPANRVDEVKKMDKAEVNKFFQDWALSRAKGAEVNGVYISVCKEPPHLQVEVGNETRLKAFTVANRDELARRIIDRFKQAKDAKDDEAKKKAYDEGLMEGVNYVYSTMKSNVGIKGAAVDRPAGDRGVGDRNVGNWAPQRRAGGGIMDMFGGIGGLLCVGLIIGLVVWVFIGLIRAFTGGGGGGYGGGGPGYGMGGFGGGGGGFMTGLLGGMFGAAAGSWLYDSFFRNSAGSGWGGGSNTAYGGQGGDNSGGGNQQDTDYSGTGGDYNDGNAGGGGGDFGGGGGGDFGGGGGGDFGGGGGGDFGGGGGDFGGGGGDFGGGGGGGGGGDF